MKTNIKHNVLALFAMILMVTVVSCKDDIVIGKIDEATLEAANTSYGYLKNANSTRTTLGIDLREDSYTNEVYFGLTKALDHDVNIVIEAADTYVDAYNKSNFTLYGMFPKELVLFANNGSISIAKGKTQSDPLGFSLSGNATLKDGTYILPIAVRKSSLGDLKLNSDSEVLYYLITVAGSIPSTAKPGGVVSICYVEVNNHNILNVGAYTLKNSGKQLFDIAVIFAANFNYDAEKKKTIIYFNPNVKHILENRLKYIKPLQNKGIKVTLSLLANHQGVGPANLTQESIIDFAAQCKATVDTYGLDGVDIDDEWADYGSVPGLPSVNATSYGRLIIELRRIMPDKLISVYYIGNTSGMRNPIDGVDVGTLVDYAYYPYYGGYSTSYANLKGLTQKKWGPAPIAFHGTSGSSSVPAPSDPTSNMNRIVSGGYGVNLCYDMRAQDYSAYLSKLSKVLYGEETVLSGEPVQKDW